MLHLHVSDTEGELLEADTELRGVQPQTGLHCIIDISAYNSLYKLLGVTAYVLHFVSNAKPLSARRSGPLSPQELNKSKLAWIGTVNSRVLARRLSTLLQNQLTVCLWFVSYACF